MNMTNPEFLEARLLEEEAVLTIAELCQAAQLEVDELARMVEEGIVTPQGLDPEQWTFSCVAVRRLRITRRLQRDLGVNLPGAALILDLLAEMEELRRRLRED